VSSDKTIASPAPLLKRANDNGLSRSQDAKSHGTGGILVDATHALQGQTGLNADAATVEHMLVGVAAAAAAANLLRLGSG
jgi:hypothetical protein